MSNWDAVIIGAGPAGLSVGALLANAGKKVLVLEKDDHVGGRASSVTYKGHIVDNGGHSPFNLGRMEEVFSRLGIDFPDRRTQTRNEFLYQGQWLSSSDWQEGSGGQEGTDQAPVSELWKMLEQEIGDVSYEALDEFDGISLDEWLSQRTDKEEVRHGLLLLARGCCLGNPDNSHSAGDMLRLIKDTLEFRSAHPGDAVPPLSYLVLGGLGKLTGPLAELIKRKGGEIRPKSKVTDLVIENGRVRGVEVETGVRILPSQFLDVEIIDAPLVVSTVPVWDLFKMVSRDEFPVWYVDWIDHIKNKVGSLYGWWVGLDKPLWDENTIRVVDWLPKTGLKQGWFIPRRGFGEAVNQHSATFLTQATYWEVPTGLQMDDAKNRREVRKTFNLLWEDLKDLFPELEERCLWKVAYLGVYNIAQVPGLTGKSRPYQLQPPGIQNLYFAGDTMSMSGVLAIQGAAESALRCVDHILARQ